MTVLQAFSHDFLKSHVDGYVKKDGTAVRPHERTQPAASPAQWRFSVMLPDSSGIRTEDEAIAYWGKHYAGNIFHLAAHSGGKTIPLKVHFHPQNDHAYSSDAGGKSKTGRREFSLERAQAMSRIVSTIEYPKSRAVNYGADLLFERNIGGKSHTVVLVWRKAVGLYEFHSSHFKSIEEVQHLLRASDRRKNDGPLQKSEPSGGYSLREGNISPNSPDIMVPLNRGTPSGGHRPFGLVSAEPEESLPLSEKMSSRAAAHFIIEQYVSCPANPFHLLMENVMKSRVETGREVFLKFFPSEPEIFDDYIESRNSISVCGDRK